MDLNQEIEQLKKEYESSQSCFAAKVQFADFPLSLKTLKGLHEAHFYVATNIQRESCLPALLGKDVVGVAETGSGKTLAFLIPVLERLFVNKWSRAVGGLAALILSPTRELAYQIFETLRKVGKYHDFSAGLVIGGKNLRFEKNRMDQCNILICTPGRLLQHMDENPLFDAHSLEILVLDEADRCLDMGFEACLNAIMRNLPSTRQTLLFSATQSSVDYLTRLNIQNSPVHVGKYCQASNVVIPKLLRQNYVIVDLEKKITMLWSFIRSHLKQKILVFLSSCKQVKYVYEVFSKLRPGTGLLALYGSLNQDRRIAIYNEFFKRNHGVLFATDIASRGLDFPDVNWVVQLDCPEDITQYIHRAGRSARNKTRGESLLVLLPSEEIPMIKELKAQNINLQKIEIDPRKLFSTETKLKAFCARSPELKLSAQRAFIAYVKSVFLMKNKNVFDVSHLHLQKFAESLGLETVPHIRFLERHLSKGTHNYNEHFSSLEDDFFTIKRVDHAISIKDDSSCANDLQIEKRKIVTKASVAKKSVRKNVEVNKILRYDADGNEIFNSEQISCLEDSKCTAFNIINAKQLLSEEDKIDKLRFKEMVKIRHRKLKEKKKRRRSSSPGIEGNDTEESCIQNTNISNNYPVNQTSAFVQSTNASLSKKPKAQSNSLKDMENIASLLLSYT